MNVTVYICGVLDAKGNRTASTMYRTAGAESREESGVERGALAWLCTVWVVTSHLLLRL